MAGVLASNSSDSNSSVVVDEKQLCDLAEGYSFVLQSVLGVLAFSTLLCKFDSVAG